MFLALRFGTSSKTATVNHARADFVESLQDENRSSDCPTVGCSPALVATTLMKARENLVGARKR